MEYIVEVKHFVFVCLAQPEFVSVMAGSIHGYGVGILQVNFDI